MHERPDTVVEIDPGHFRGVLGHYPTGVYVATGCDEGRRASGLVVGSFTSVSLYPPLVAFFPDKSSTSWPKVRSCGHFCVSIIGADQLELCKTFAGKGGDKFEGVSHRMTERGMPVLDGVVAYIECHLEQEIDAGDRTLVLGRVQDLQVESGREPLLFFWGKYGHLAQLA